MGFDEHNFGLEMDWPAAGQSQQILGSSCRCQGGISRPPICSYQITFPMECFVVHGWLSLGVQRVGDAKKQ